MSCRKRNCEYAARDAAILMPLREKLFERLKSDSLMNVAALEFDCIMVVAEMELTGFYMHKDRWLEQLAIVETKKSRLAEELQSVLAEESSQGTLFGGPQRDDINLDSHQQLTKALERLGITLPDSTRNWKLQPLAAEYPIIGTLAGIPHGAKSVDQLWSEHDRLDQSNHAPAAR